MKSRTSLAWWLPAALCMGLSVGGCAPTRVDMVNAVKGYSLPSDVTIGNGLIYVIDATPALLQFSRTVLLDGDDDAAKVGSLMPGTYIFFPVMPGHHRVKVPEWSPYELIVDVEEGDILFLQTVIDQRAKKKFVQQVDGVVGRYNVMRFTPGDMSRPAGPE